MTLLFKIILQYSAEVLSSVPKCKKPVMCLMEKTCMLDKFCSGVSYSAAGSEFNVNESITYIKYLFKQKHTQNKVMIKMS